MTQETTEETAAEGRRDAPEGTWPRVRAWFQRYGRWVLLALGALAVALLVYTEGPAEVWAAVVAAGPYLPFIALAELLFISMDAVSLAFLHGARSRDVPVTTWIRSALIHYGVMVLLPAGRAGGELMRATMLAPHVGGPRAAAAAAVQQGVLLLGNTLISIPCYVAVALAVGPTSVLAIGVGLNGLATFVISVLVLFGARFSSVGGWLGRRISALAAHGAHFDDSLKALPTVPVPSIVAALLGRVFQTVQYGLIVMAVGASLTPSTALIGQAIHLVGAGLGDMIPNQVGVTEGAFRLFADSLGVTTAAAVAIALVHRIVQFSLAGMSFLVSALWGHAAASAAPVESEA
jgi:uncharacterized protein YhhL (DUF1145 family)